MSDSNQRTLLEELDARQDEVLKQLDDLNARIKQLLQEATASQNPAAATAARSPAA